MEYKNLESQHLIQHQGLTFRLVLAVIGITAGSFSFGYNIGVINAPEELIKEFMNTSEYDSQGTYMSEDQLINLWAFTVAVFSLGASAGGLLSGWWATRIGRKRGCLANTLVGVLAAGLMFGSRRAGHYEMLIVGRVIIGIHAGLYTGLNPMYLTEISTPAIRGALGVIHNLAAVTGLFVSQILGFPEILGTWDKWDILLGMTAVPCFVQMVILPLCEDSPRYLLINCNNVPAANKALSRLRGTDDNDDEITEIVEEMNSMKEKVTIVQLFTTPYLRRPTIMVIVMQLSQQLSGINAVQFYSTGIFKEVANLSTPEATHVSSVIGAVMVVMVIVSVPLMDRVGRRVMHLLGLGGCVFCHIMITVLMGLKNEVSWFDVASIPAMLLFIFFFALGPASIPWLIQAEMFSHAARPAAVSVSVLINWLASFTVGYVFPEMKEALHDFCFLPFTGITIVCFIYIYYKLPETKGKTFQDIAEFYRSEDKGRKDTTTAAYQSDLNSRPDGRVNLGFNRKTSLFGD